MAGTTDAVRRALAGGDARKARFQALFAVHYVAFSGFAVFRNVYLEEMGMTGAQMGAVGFVMTVGATVAQPVWGAVSDRFRIEKAVLVVGAAVSAVGLFAYPLGARLADPFPLVVAGTALYAAFHAPIVPIANSLVLARGFDYGTVRAFGSVAFGAGSLAFGYLVASVGTASVVYFYAAGMVALVAIARGLDVGSGAEPAADDGDGGNHETEPEHLAPSPLSLVRRPAFLVLLAVGFVVGGAMRGGSAFFSVYVRAVGAPDSLTGLAWALKIVFEAVAFVFALRLGLAYRRLLVLGGLATAVPFAGYWLSGAPAVVLAVQPVGGVGYALFYLAAVNLAHAVAPDALRSTAQTVLAGVGIGAGGAVGQVVAGHLYDAVGVQELYAYVALAGAAGAAVALLVRAPDGEPETPVAAD